MTLERKIILALSLIILAGGCIFGYEALQSHDALLRASEGQKASDAIKAEKDRAISDRDALQKQYAQTISEALAKVKTTQQAATVVDHYIPSPTPTIVVQREQLTPAEQAKLPDAPSYTIQTQDQAIGTAKKLLQCDADEAGLQACKLDLADTNVKLVSEQKQSGIWQNAAKGGSKWQRVWTASKYIVIGGAVGYLAGHKF